MHHDTVAFLLHLDQKFAYPPVRNPHSLGRIALRHYSLSSALQPFQPIPFLLAHRDSFHPSSLSAVNRNFLLCPIRNFSLCSSVASSSPASRSLIVSSRPKNAVSRKRRVRVQPGWGLNWSKLFVGHLRRDSPRKRQCQRIAVVGTCESA